MRPLVGGVISCIAVNLIICTGGAWATHLQQPLVPRPVATPIGRALLY
jgi:hypothetical protein